MLEHKEGTNFLHDDIPHEPPKPLDVVALVEGARRGEQACWTALIERYTPLVRGVARRYRLNDGDSEDVAQTVWLQLVRYLERIREPRALPKWIVTTARHESVRLARSRAATLSIESLADGPDEPPADHVEVDFGLLRAEEAQALRDGLAALPRPHRELLLMLSAEPPLSYRDISRLLHMPIGSIGPTRARSLQRLRTTPAMRRHLSSTGRIVRRRACSA
ncbi:MAG: RNA polymerase sigma factor [Pseudonocardiaceae bacterium]